MANILDAFSLEGKTAVVTGADKGLGQAMAIALAEAGADVLGVSRQPKTPETEAAITATGRRYLHRSADLSSLDPVAGIVEEAIQAFGRIDILVNNAGVIRRSDAIEYSVEDWDQVMNVNLKSLFFLSQAVAKTMVARGGGGKIINVASMLSFQGGLRVPAYTAAKSGVKGLTMALANEWAKAGIQVNAIAPGYMATDNTGQLRQDAKRSEEILARIPSGRWGLASDLAGAVVFLASAASDYVTGHTLAVDGGWLGR